MSDSTDYGAPSSPLSPLQWAMCVALGAIVIAGLCLALAGCVSVPMPPAPPVNPITEVFK